MNVVNLPEAGEAVSLACNLDAMEALNSAYGEEYISITFRRLDLCDPSCLKLCLEHMASEPVVLGDLVKVLPLTEISLRIADAVHLAWKGETISGAVAVSGDVRN